MPNCGLMERRPKQIPPTIDRRSSCFSPPLIKLAVMNPICPVKTLIAAAGATASIGNRSPHEAIRRDPEIKRHAPQAPRDIGGAVF